MCDMELKSSGVILVVAIFCVALTSYTYYRPETFGVGQNDWEQPKFHSDKLHHRHNLSTPLWNLDIAYLSNIKISFLGDSTAFRTANAMETLLGNCKTTMSERGGLGRTIDVIYFNKENFPGFSFKNRECSGCHSSVRKCDVFNVTLEYFTLEKIDDKTITGGGFNTTIEFLLKHWWVKTGHPNVIFHQATMVHDLKEANEKQEYEYYKDFFSKMLLYTKTYSSTYFWSNSPKVTEKLVPPQFRNWTKNLNIKTFNDAVKTCLLTQKYTKNGSQSNERLNLGLDLYRWSENIQPRAYRDAIHHVSEWYKLVANHLLTMYYIWKTS